MMIHPQNVFVDVVRRAPCSTHIDDSPYDMDGDLVESVVSILHIPKPF
jgi:hypothetical protein